MKLTKRKIQKIMNKYYKNEDSISVKNVNQSAKGLNQTAFAINSPYVDNMGDIISLTLYYNTKDKQYILSDDGFSYFNVAPDGIPKDSFLSKYIQKTANLSGQQMIKTTFNPESEVFEAKFSDINKLANAYHSMMETIISFQGILDYISLHQDYRQKKLQIDEKDMNSLRHEIQSNPKKATQSRDFYNHEKGERDNGIQLLDNIEGLIRMHATRAYVQSLRAQVQNANEFLSAFSGSKDYPTQAGIDAKQLSKHLDSDVNNFMKRFKEIRAIGDNPTKSLPFKH